MPPLSLYLTECCRVFCVGQTPAHLPLTAHLVCAQAACETTPERETRYLWWMLIRLTLRHLPQTETLTRVACHVGASLCTEQPLRKGASEENPVFAETSFRVQRGPGIGGSVVTNYYGQKRDKLLEGHRGVWTVTALWAIITGSIRNEEKPFLQSRPQPALQDKTRTLSQTGRGRAAGGARRPPCTRHSCAWTPTWAHRANLCAELHVFCLQLKKD